MAMAMAMMVMAMATTTTMATIPTRRSVRLRQLVLLGLLGLLGLLAGACGSYSTYRTTRLAAPGRTELLAGVQVAGFHAPDGAGAPMPELALAARRGLGDRYEVQANGTLLALKQGRTGSLELGGKMRVLADGRWSLAVGAAAGYRIAESGGAIIEGAFVSAPVIGGVELGRHQLVVSVTGGYQRWYSSGARPVDVPFVGPSLGFLWQIKQRWALLPEIGSAYTPMKSTMSDESRLFHAGVAVVWSR